jgi:hypothetical protein
VDAAYAPNAQVILSGAGRTIGLIVAGLTVGDCCGTEGTTYASNIEVVYSAAASSTIRCINAV